MFLHTKKALSLLAILIPAAALWAQSSSGELPRPATMEQCVQYAIEHNISINQAQMNTELAKVDKTDAIGAFLPSAGLSSNYNFSKGFSFDANTNQRTNREQQTMSLNVSTQLNLFNGLKDLNNLRRARLEYASQRYNSEKILNDVSLNVVSAYISILAALEYQKVAQSQYELSKMQVERLETLYKAGKNSLGDLYEVQASLARDEQALVAANNQVDLAYLSLKQLLALDLTYDLQIDTLGYDQVSLSPLMSTSTVEIYRSAEANLPEMRKARNDIEVSRRSLAIARGSYLPTLSASWLGRQLYLRLPQHQHRCPHQHRRTVGQQLPPQYRREPVYPHLQPSVHLQRRQPLEDQPGSRPAEPAAGPTGVATKRRESLFGCRILVQELSGCRQGRRIVPRGLALRHRKI